MRRTRSPLRAAWLLASLMLLPLTASAVRLAADDEGESTPAFAEKGVTQHDYYFRKRTDWFDLYVSIQLLRMKEAAPPEGIVPLIFGLTNKNRRAFTIRRDEIRLHDRYGNELPALTLKDVRQGYRLLRRDHQILDLTAFGGKFDRNRRIVPTNFYPMPGQASITVTQIHQNRRVKDLLYFKGALEKGELYRLIVRFRKRDFEIHLPFLAP